MRPNGQAFLGSRGIFETKPHRKAFPGGRQVQGKTRVWSVAFWVKPPENWLPSYDYRC